MSQIDSKPDGSTFTFSQMNFGRGGQGYLPTLQERQKWLQPKPNFKVGDLVLLADKNLSRGQWPKGSVEQTYPDSEGMVRQVVVRTADGVYRRDVRKLCLLEEQLLGGLEQRPKLL